MISSILPKRNAFIKGSDLWVISDIQSSKWTKKINWYLNFQIYKLKSVKQLNRDQMAYLSDAGFDFKNIKAKTGSILISSDKLLTNKKTLIIPFNNLKKWLSMAKACWDGLGRPSVRFFTPDKANADDILTHLEQDGFDVPVHVVPSLLAKK